MELLNYVKENDLERFKQNLDMDSVEEVDENKNTILHHCVELGLYDYVDALLYNGADPNARNREGDTPLHIASKKNYGEIMDILLSFGGDLDIKNNHQRNVVSIAMASKSKDVLKVIENSGMDYDDSESHFEKMGHHRRIDD